MLDDFCSSCLYRQGPMTQPMGQMGPMTPMGCPGQMSMQMPNQMPNQMQNQMPNQMQNQMPNQMPMGGSMDMSNMPMSQNIFQTPQMQNQMPLGGTAMQPQGPSNIPGVTLNQPTESPVYSDIGYTQGFLRSQIGKYVKIDFLIGTNMLVDREGTLLDVGISYVVIREAESDDQLMCDIYSIKFVRIYY